MRKIIKRKWIILIVILLLTMGIIYVYEPFSPGNKGPLSLSSPSYKDTGLFKINPETILASLDQGDTGVFLPDSRSLDDRYNGPALYTGPILWSQADNLTIVNALNKYVWKDTLDNWRLYSMAFNVDCQDNLSGLPGGNFQYFKTIFDKGKVIDIWREVEIAPEYSWVAWGGSAKFAHPLLGWESIDLSRLKVTAEDAIRIAEEHGGREARSKIQNKCSIHLSLVPAGHKGWWVNYGYSSGFGILIDSSTGKVIKTLTPPQLPSNMMPMDTASNPPSTERQLTLSARTMK